MSLKGTKTEDNLKAAFSGESQANRRYLYFAQKADVEGYNDVAAVFRSTAEGETGHAHGHLEFLEETGDPATGRIERFLTGPKGGEVTGMTWTGDKRTMFVGIQHPGAPFPDGEGKLPRSTIVAVKREDKARIG